MRMRIGLLLFVCLVVLGGVAGASFAAEAEDTRYQVTTIVGKLTDPATKKPMAGATLRFQPIEEGIETVEATTDATGAFAAKGLRFANYVIEITTADGEKILGVNQLPIVQGQPVAIEMRISDRIVSKTSLENRPQRFMAVVDREKINWKKFWAEFGIFFGAAATGGVAAM